MSSAASRLRPILPRVLVLLERSGMEFAAIVGEALQDACRAAAGRGSGGTRSSQARSSAKRALVRLAISDHAAVLAVKNKRDHCEKVRGWMERQPIRYGRTVSPAVIRDELRNWYLSTETPAQARKAA